MRISARTQYALRAATELAAAPPGPCPPRRSPWRRTSRGGSWTTSCCSSGGPGSSTACAAPRGLLAGAPAEEITLADVIVVIEGKSRISAHGGYPGVAGPWPTSGARCATTRNPAHRGHPRSDRQGRAGSVTTARATTAPAGGRACLRAARDMAPPGRGARARRVRCSQAAPRRHSRPDDFSWEGVDTNLPGDAGRGERGGREGREGRERERREEGRASEEKRTGGAQRAPVGAERPGPIHIPAECVMIIAI